MPTSPADSRADARRLIEALPHSLPRDEARRANAVQGALLASGLLDSNDLGNSPAVAAATRDGLTSLAHLLDEDAPGHGAGQLLLLLLAERNTFKAPEQTHIFQCEHIALHPRPGAGPRAFGFMRNYAPDSAWFSTALTLGDFAEAEWTRIPEKRSPGAPAGDAAPAAPATS